MSVTILEALQNAQHNFKNAAFMPVMLPIANEQLNNAVVLLEKGYDIYTEVEPLLEEYGSVEDVPEKEQ
jgi:hypothetical protein